MKQLAQGDWIKARENVFTTGSAGVGKSYLAALLGHHACRQGYNVLYKQASKLFDELYAARADGHHRVKLRQIASVDVLIIDDWGLTTPNDAMRADFYDIVYERYDKAATVITSQRAPNEWYAYIGEPLIADACLDRIVHEAHSIEVVGESYRMIKGQRKRLQEKKLQSATKDDNKLVN